MPATAGRPASRAASLQPQGAKGSPGERPSLLRRTLHGLMMILAPLVLLTALAAGVGYFRLMQGPISLKFLVEPVERGINEQFKSFQTNIDDVVVTIAEQGGVDFRLTNLRMSETDGDLVVSATKASMQLSLPALWSMQVVPARVELIEPRLFLFYSPTEGLSLRFSPGAQSGVELERLGEPGVVIPPSPVPARPGAVTGEAREVLGELDLPRLISEQAAAARRGEAASSFLRELGMRDATVVLDAHGRTSLWQVPRLLVDLDHRNTRSVISGSARISSSGRIWSVAFHTEDSASDDRLALTASVKGLVPRIAADILPQLGLLRSLDMPVSGEAKLKLSEGGGIHTADLALEIGAGRVDLPELSGEPFAIDAGLVQLSYDGAAQRLTMKPSTLRWGDSSLTLDGEMTPLARDGADSGAWQYRLSATQGVLSAAEFRIPPLPIDVWSATGVLDTGAGQLKLDELRIAAGGGEVTISGEIDSSAREAGFRLSGKIGAMPLPAVKALWPRSLASGARQWTGRQVDAGRLAGGTFQYLTGRFLSEAGPEAAGQGYRMSLALEAADVVLRPVEGLAPLKVPRALVRVENEALEIAVPEGHLTLADGTSVPLRAGRVVAADTLSELAEAEIGFNFSAPVTAMLKLAETPFVTRVAGPLAVPGTVSGAVDGEMRLSLPLVEDLQAQDVKFKAKARLTDGSATGLIGGYVLKGGAVDFELDQNALDAKGQVLVQGVLAKLNWQRIFAASRDQQPPLRLTASLDAADRKQLGLDLSQSVQGEVPVEVTVHPAAEGSRERIHLRADLTAAELIIDNISWRKAAGRAAYLECDIVNLPNGRTELSGFTIGGDDIAVEGKVALGAGNRLSSFDFPRFSLNLITRLQVSGELQADKVWRIRVRGQTYDGKPYFRSLFSVGRLDDERAADSVAQEGLDLKAEIDNVLGFSDVSLRNVTLELSQRRGRLTALQARGTLDGGKPLAIELRRDRSGRRQLLADSTDAGQAFKLIGFYPNASGGRVRLEVDLEGKGAAEKTGTLWVESFQVLGDPIVSEVVGSIEGDTARQGRQRQVTRQVFDFDRMRVPFSVGHGQFVVDDAYVRGPLLGASLRGKVDFGRSWVNLGGTYVPLQGLNNAFGSIPLIGDLLSGPRREGIFGVTFAITGAMANPQVLVNPLSLVAPGIFREIFQLTPDGQRIQARDPEPDRGSSARPSAQGARPAGKSNVDGWNSETRRP